MFILRKALQVGGRHPQRAQAALVGLLLAVCAAVIGYQAFEALQARSRVIEQSRREAENLAWGASQQAEGAFLLVDAFLAGLADRIKIDGIGPAALERLQSFMALRLANSPMLDDLMLIDADGTVVAAGRASPTFDVAFLDFFQTLREHSGHGLAFGSVYRSTRTGRQVIPISLRMGRLDGSFSGSLTATIETEFFIDFFKTFDLGHDGAAVLRRADGALLVRQSRVEAAADGVEASSAAYVFPPQMTGISEIVSPIDHVERIVSYRRLAGYPIVVAMALGKVEALAGWRADATGRVVGTSLVAMLVGSLGLWLMQLLRQAAASDRRITAEAAVQNTANLERLARHLSAARDRAESANRAKSRFLAAMSHELRTPLNGVLGYAQLLRNEGSLNAGQTARVDSMLTAGRHLVEMISSVLDLSQIEAGHAELRPSRFDVAEVAAACLDLVRPTAAAKGLELTLTVEPGAPEQLLADRTRLRQVLLNLLGNAVKFTESGSVALRVGLSGEALRIEVADTGPGIARDLRAQLFREFERLGAETATVEGPV